MPMEKISKYTKFFDLVVIGDESSCGSVCELGTLYFKSMRCIPFDYETAKPLTCHILILNGTYAQMSSPTARTLISNIQRIDLFVLSDENPSIAMYKEAMSHRAAYVGKKITNEQEFSNLLLSMLPSVIKRHNEALAVLNYKQIVDNTSHMFWLTRGEKGVFANESFKRFFGINSLGEFDRTEQARQLSGVTTTSLIEFDNLRSQPNSFLVSSNKINAVETLVELSMMPESLQAGEKGFLNRMTFIELLKDAFVIHQHEDEPIPVVIMVIENAEKITEEFGEKVYNDVCREIVTLATKHFDPMTEIGLWHKDVFVIINEGGTLDDLKACLERLHENVVSQTSIEGAIPILDSFVVDMSKLPLDKAITIIDHIHNRELRASDLSHMIYHEVFFDDKNTNIKDQALHYLERSFLAKSQVKLLNFYKGIRINTVGQIIKIADGFVFMAIEKIQGYAMKLEESVVIQGTNLPFDIGADIKFVDIAKKVAVFRNFEPLRISANARKHIRIQSDHRMHVTINAVKNVMSATILDISIKSIACRVNNTKGLPEKGTMVTLQFHLPSRRFEDGVVSMLVMGRIEFIQENDEFTKVVVLLELEEPYESFLIEYIYARQQELVSEIKSIVSKL